MSPFLIYLIMQADNIQNTLAAASIISGIAIIVCGGAALMLYTYVLEYDIENKTKDWKDYQLAKKLLFRFVGVFFVTFILAALMPSTKTLAAMVILPKITSPEAVQKIGDEGTQLLELTKDALRNLGTKKKEPKHD